MASDPTLREERRVAPRAAPRAPIQVHFSVGRQDGSGVVGDLSLSGAWISDASSAPDSGTQLDLLMTCEAIVETALVPVEVVRRAKGGFAVRFRRLDRSLHDFLVKVLPGTTGAG